MSIDYDSWLGSGTAIDASRRAVFAWRRIQRQASAITVIRSGSALAEQTVRISYSSGASESQAEAGQSSRRSVTVFGVASHPDSGVPDTDLQRLDRFEWNGETYQVTDVISYPGEVQASGEVFDA